MDGYAMDTFKGQATTMFKFALGIMGLAQFQSAATGISTLKSTGAKAEATLSVQCFCNMCAWASFLLLDGRMLVGLMHRPAGFPIESLYANMVLMTTMATINFLGWKESGGLMPDFQAFDYNGRCRLPMIVGAVNYGFFALGCGFGTVAFLDMYFPGVVDTLPQSSLVTSMIHLVLGNAGKLMLMNIATSLALSSVGDEATSYRLFRVANYTNMLYLGMLAREHTLADALGWPQPMHMMTFAQCFATAFFMASRYAAIPVSLKTGK